MTFEHVNVKLFVQTPEKHLDDVLEPLVPVFHRWIQERAFGELLLDVADYRHVYAGPGVILIGNDGDYAIDNTGNQLGVLYNRKSAFSGTNQDRLKQSAKAALGAYEKMQSEPSLRGKFAFDGKKIQLIFNDRFLSPNAAETKSAFEPELNAFCAKLFGGAAYTATYESDSRKRFGVTLEPAQPIPPSQLLANLGV